MRDNGSNGRVEEVPSNLYSTVTILENKLDVVAHRLEGVSETIIGMSHVLDMDRDSIVLSGEVGCKPSVAQRIENSLLQANRIEEIVDKLIDELK